MYNPQGLWLFVHWRCYYSSLRVCDYSSPYGCDYPQFFGRAASVPAAKWPKQAGPDSQSAKMKLDRNFSSWQLYILCSTCLKGIYALPMPNPIPCAHWQPPVSQTPLRLRVKNYISNMRKQSSEVTGGKSRQLLPKGYFADDTQHTVAAHSTRSTHWVEKGKLHWPCPVHPVLPTPPRSTKTLLLPYSAKYVSFCNINDKHWELQMLSCVALYSLCRPVTTGWSKDIDN